MTAMILVCIHNNRRIHRVIHRGDTLYIVDGTCFAHARISDAMRHAATL